MHATCQQSCVRALHACATFWKKTHGDHRADATCTAHSATCISCMCRCRCCAAVRTLCLHLGARKMSADVYCFACAPLPLQTKDGCLTPVTLQSEASAAQAPTWPMNPWGPRGPSRVEPQTKSAVFGRSAVCAQVADAAHSSRRRFAPKRCAFACRVSTERVLAQPATARSLRIRPSKRRCFSARPLLRPRGACRPPERAQGARLAAATLPSRPKAPHENQQHNSRQAAYVLRLRPNNGGLVRCARHHGCLDAMVDGAARGLQQVGLGQESMGVGVGVAQLRRGRFVAQKIFTVLHPLWATLADPFSSTSCL